MNKIKKLLFLVLCSTFLTGCEFTVSLTSVFSEVIQVGNDYLVEVHNNSNIEKDVSISLEFLDSKEKVVDTIENSIISVPANGISSIMLEGIDINSYSSYKVTVEGSDSIYKNMVKELKYSEKKDEKKHIFNLENTGNYKMSYIDFLIVYYKDNIAIDTFEIIEKDLKPGSKTTIKKDKKITDYDNIKVYVNTYTEDKIEVEPEYDY